MLAARARAAPSQLLAYHPTHTQALTYGLTLANYDLGGPVAPLPRNEPVNLVPFCLQFFNFAVLDDFA